MMYSFSPYVRREVPLDGRIRRLATNLCCRADELTTNKRVAAVEKEKQKKSVDALPCGGRDERRRRATFLFNHMYIYVLCGSAWNNAPLISLLYGLSRVQC